MDMLERAMAVGVGLLATGGFALAVTANRRLGQLRRRLRRAERESGVIAHQVVGLWRDAARRLIADVHGVAAARRVEFHANSGEDAILTLLFGAKGGGYVVEAGAFDGRTHSVSWTLEQLGWAGLLVEARPDSAAECERRRPGMRTVHGALAGPDAPAAMTFMMMEGDADSARRSRVEAMSSESRGRVGRGVREVRVSVPTATLGGLLAGVGEIDALVLDLEGGEYEALRGLGDAAARVRCMLIEDPVSASDDRVHTLIGRMGLVPAARFGLNVLFVRERDGELLARANQLMYMARRRPGEQTEQPERVTGVNAGR